VDDVCSWLSDCDFVDFLVGVDGCDVGVEVFVGCDYCFVCGVVIG